MSHISRGDAVRSPAAARTTTKRRAWAISAVLVLLIAVLLAGWVRQTQAGEPAASKPTAATTLALVADFGNCGPGAQRVADMIDTWEVAAVATAGDNTYDDDPACTPFTKSVGDYYGAYIDDPAGPRFWPALGNHDYENEGAGLAAYRSFFSYLSTQADPQQRWYATTVGDVNLFVLDNDAPAADLAAQRTWLREGLAAARVSNPSAWNVVVFHKPAFTSGSHEPETEMQPSAGWDYRGWGADVVIAGHQHVYEDVLVDGFHYVTAGIATNGLDRGGCKPQLTTGSRVCFEGEGAMRLVASPTSLTMEYRQPSDAGDVVLDVITLPR